MNTRLSKSHIMAFRQCPKRLWLEVHRNDLRGDAADSEPRFVAGRQVGEFARLQYPSGVLIAPENSRDLSAALSGTKTMLCSSPRPTVFEATFCAADVLVRTDLLVPQRGGWHLAEVKSSTKVKDYHVEDTAVQTWVAQTAGLALTAVSLQIIDSDWTYLGRGKYSGLFKLESMDEAIKPYLPEVPKWIAAAHKTVAGTEPAIEMGNQCNKPFACDFQDHCSSLVPPVQYPIQWLPRLSAKQLASIEARDITDLRKVPVELLKDLQQRVQAVTRTGKVFCSPLTPPQLRSVAPKKRRYYLDFETVALAVPIWAWTNPYEQVPFQWSCHIEEADGSIEHRMFLDLSGRDPRKAFAQSLIEVLGKSGPIIVYNAPFEKNVIDSLMNPCRPLYASLSDLDLILIFNRIVDLLPLTKQHYYHPAMAGSWSLKRVLPTIRSDLGYENLDGVADGAAAMNAYSEAIAAHTTAARRAQIEAELRRYCARDTEGMIHLLRRLEGR